MRNTKQKALINEILKCCCDHPTADVIYSRARLVEPNISLGTVYRNLHKLAESGEILTIETVDKKLHFDGNTCEHQHFLCSKCGKIVDIFSKPKLPEELDCGYVLKEAKCVYYGVCPDCVEV